MYPVKLGFEEAINRIQKLLKNEHYAESLVTSTFTIEKTLRRTLKLLIISAGFKSKIADKMIKNIRGFEAINNSWEFYDPDHKKLTEIISPEDWKVIKDNSKMRNYLIHGIRVYDRMKCKIETEKNITTLYNLKKCLENNYGYSGWSPISIRKVSRLHIDQRFIKTS